jgi:hypothetical protein
MTAMLIVSKWDQFCFSILNDLNIVRIVLFPRPKLSSYISATLNAPFTKRSGQIEITFNYVHAKLPAVKITRSFFNYPLLFLITRSFYPRPAPFTRDPLLLPAPRSFYPLPAPNRYSLEVTLYILTSLFVFDAEFQSHILIFHY